MTHTNTTICSCCQARINRREWLKDKLIGLAFCVPVVVLYVYYLTCNMPHHFLGGVV